VPLPLGIRAQATLFAAIWPARRLFADGEPLSITMRKWLIHREIFEAEVCSYRFSPARRSAIRSGVRHLLNRTADGFMRSTGTFEITETKAQQAFNRHIFEETLQFSGLLGAMADYSILPELSFGGKQSKWRTDLAIGRFSPRQAAVHAIVELKSPGADLMTPQTGDSYKNPNDGTQMSACTQAILTMKAARVDWAVVSNMKELILFYSGQTDAALHIDLMNLKLEDERLLDFCFSDGAFGSNTSAFARLPRVVMLANRIGV
jgi:hypothetical protein